MHVDMKDDLARRLKVQALAGLLGWAVLGWARLLCRRLLGWACAVPTAAGLGSAAVPTAALAATKCSRIGAPPGLLAGPKWDRPVAPTKTVIF